MLLVQNKRLRLIGGAIETCSFLALKLWLRHPEGARSFAGRSYRVYMSLVKRDKWRSQTIDEIFPAHEPCRITLEHLPGQGINTALDELAYMALIARRLRPKRIFEIGTFRGRTALNFALNSPDDCVIYTLDLPPETRDIVLNEANTADAAIIRASATGVDYHGKPEARKIRQLLGDSASFDFSPYEHQMDIVFVDGAHHFRAAAADTRSALRMLRPGGLLLWHDFANYGDYNDVTRAVLDALPADDVVQILDSQLALYRKPDTAPLPLRRAPSTAIASSEDLTR